MAGIYTGYADAMQLNCILMTDLARTLNGLNVITWFRVFKIEQHSYGGCGQKFNVQR